MRRMSRTIVLAALPGLLIPGAGAFGQWITNISEAEDTGIAYLVGGLSADGRYVGISRYIEWGANQTPYDGPALYDTMTDTYLPLRLQSGNSAVRGVEALADGTPVSLVIEVTNANTASWRKGVFEGVIDESGYLYYFTGSKDEHGIPGNMNAMALDSDGNGWMVGGSYQGLNANAWPISNGVVATLATYSAQKYPGTNVLNGVSRTGLAVGNWRDDNGSRAYVADVKPGGINRALIFVEFGTSNTAQGNAMSGSGLWAGGYFTVTENANTLHGWRNAVDATFTTNGVMEELFPVGFDPDVVQQSNVFDIADVGTAVGFTYDSTVISEDPLVAVGYQATLWPANSNQGVLVSDILSGKGVDLSEWQKLERVISISDDGTVVAGRGVLASDGSYSAFVASLGDMPVYGACCVSTGPGVGTCSMQTQAECENIPNSTYHGDGVPCGQDTCGDFCPVPFADADRDSDVDQADFAWFQACYSETSVAEGCACFDRNEDGAITLEDFGNPASPQPNTFAGCYSGPAIPADPDCEIVP